MKYFTLPALLLLVACSKSKENKPASIDTCDQITESFDPHPYTTLGPQKVYTNRLTGIRHTIRRGSVSYVKDSSGRAIAMQDGFSFTYRCPQETMVH